MKEVNSSTTFTYVLNGSILYTRTRYRTYVLYLQYSVSCQFISRNFLIFFLRRHFQLFCLDFSMMMMIHSFIETARRQPQFDTNFHFVILNLL